MTTPDPIHGRRVYHHAFRSLRHPAAIAITSLAVKQDANVSDPTSVGNIRIEQHGSDHSRRALIFRDEHVRCAAACVFRAADIS